MSDIKQQQEQQQDCGNEGGETPIFGAPFLPGGPFVPPFCVGTPSKPFSFKCEFNGLALDGGNTAGTCDDQEHPRTYLSPYDPANVLLSQKWVLIKVTGTTDRYQLQNCATLRMLDGNTTVWNVDPLRPLPFTWTEVLPVPKNHQWFFNSVDGSDQVFFIRSEFGPAEAVKKNLDGNFPLVFQPCPSKVSPFIYAPDSAAVSQHWKLFQHAS